MSTNSRRWASDLRRWIRYICRAEIPHTRRWGDNDPHRLSETVGKTGNVEISTWDKTQVHHLREFMDALGGSIDKPILPKYPGSEYRSAGPPSTSDIVENTPLGAKAGTSTQIRSEFSKNG